MNALIGNSGFVGSTLLKQTTFDDQYRSTNISEIEGRIFDTVLCAGAPAQKWIANRDPEADRHIIDGLTAHLATIRCKTMILISTVDVFRVPVGVDEGTEVDETDIHAYGLHRRMLERFVEDHFAEHLIVRLPGLVGPGLRKNIIFDLLNTGNITAIDSRSVFQFYPMVNLWYDIQTSLRAGLSLIHLTAEPVSVAEVASNGFGRVFNNYLSQTPAVYDLRSKHAKAFGSSNAYQYSKRESLQAIRAYAQSEPMTSSKMNGTNL